MTRARSEAKEPLKGHRRRVIAIWGMGLCFVGFIAFLTMFLHLGA